jgi:hypothetical protein
MRGRALRRSLEHDALRVNAPIVNIVSTTEMVTPDMAKEWLKANRLNRPVNWGRVSQYAADMTAGKWRLHDQGLMFDTHGNLMTGQTRLWAIVTSGLNIYMRVSRGNPPEAATLVDRGTPQSARDLAARKSGRAHSPSEASLGRAIAALSGTIKPSKDELADAISAYAKPIAEVLARAKGQKKTRAMLMIMAALISDDEAHAPDRMSQLPILCDKLSAALAPRTADECWGRGAAFSLALEAARRIVRET